MEILFVLTFQYLSDQKNFYSKIQVMTDNITGKGLDVPILGIRRAVEEIWPSAELQGKEESKKHLKALFQDPVFDTANKFKLSTSQVCRIW